MLPTFQVSPSKYKKDPHESYTSVWSLQIDSMLGRIAGQTSKQRFPVLVWFSSMSLRALTEWGRKRINVVLVVWDIFFRQLVICLWQKCLWTSLPCCFVGLWIDSSALNISRQYFWARAPIQSHSLLSATGSCKFLFFFFFFGGGRSNATCFRSRFIGRVGQ